MEKKTVMKVAYVAAEEVFAFTLGDPPFVLKVPVQDMANFAVLVNAANDADIFADAWTLEMGWSGYPGGIRYGLPDTEEINLSDTSN